jgi:hypothetical protein|tara:strand:+ start:368 stop:583 length:216 start_codon:yes stop_codon:yes gene_type:complete
MDYYFVVYTLGGILLILIMILVKQYLFKSKVDSNPYQHQDHARLVEMHLIQSDQIKQNKHFNDWLEGNKKL